MHSDAITALRQNIKLRYPELNQWFNHLSLTEDGILLRDTRFVIPSSLIQRMIDIGHTGHQGVVKTKTLIRCHVWFPKLDAAVEKTIRHCLKCQANTDKTTSEPIKSLPLPQGSWEEVDTDFFGPLPNAKYFMVFICGIVNS